MVLFPTSGPSRRELSLPVARQPTLIGPWNRTHTSFYLEPTAQSPLRLSEVACSLSDYPIPDKTARLELGTSMGSSGRQLSGYILVICSVPESCLSSDETD